MELAETDIEGFRWQRCSRRRIGAHRMGIEFLLTKKTQLHHSLKFEFCSSVLGSYVGRLHNGGGVGRSTSVVSIFKQFSHIWRQLSALIPLPLKLCRSLSYK